MEYGGNEMTQYTWVSHVDMVLFDRPISHRKIELIANVSF